MRDRDDEDPLCFDAVDDRERKPAEEEAAGVVQIQRPPLGMIGDMLDGSVERRHEADGNCRIARTVAQPCFSSLRFGRGVKREIQGVQLSRVMRWRASLQGTG